MVKGWLMAGALIGMSCLPLFGQAPPEKPGNAGSRVGAGRREMAKLYLVQRMREALSLTDAQTLKVMDALNAIDEARQARQAELKAYAVRLQGHLSDGSTSQETFKKDVEEFKRLRVNFEGSMKKLEERLLNTLTPRQQVQFLLLRRKLMRGAIAASGRPHRRYDRGSRGRRGRRFR